MNRLSLVVLLLLGISHAAEAAGPRRERPLTCPRELRSTGTLLIKLGPRHGDEMAILRKSDGALFVLVSKEKELLMSSEDFKKTVLFQVHPGSELSSTDGRSQRIFSTPGEYQVIVADDAESSRGGHRCTIDFTG